MNLIKIFDNPKQRKILKAAFKNNKEHFRILNECDYTGGKFIKYESNSYNECFKYSFYKNKNNQLICYGTKLIEEGEKLKSVRCLLFKLTNDFKLYAYQFNQIDEYLCTTTNLLTNIYLWDFDSEITDYLFNYLVESNSWLRFYIEHRIEENCHIIVREKLFSLKKYYSFIYPGIPFNKTKEINELTLRSLESSDFYFKLDKYFFKDNIEVLDNLQNINLDLFSFSYEKLEETKLIEISVELAKILNKKINCGWSKRRLEEFLDDSSYLVTNIFGRYKDEKLTPDQIFIKFAKKYKLWYPKKFSELVMLGFNNRNCIGTYWTDINSGERMIFKYKDCVFELNKMFLDQYIFLTINQVRGKYNSNISSEIKNEIDYLVNEFNNKIKPGGLALTNTNNWECRTEMIYPPLGENIDVVLTTTTTSIPINFNITDYTYITNE